MTQARTADPSVTPATERPAHGISFREATLVWVKVAALSFGGPAGQIAVMHRILVEQKKWVGENRFLHALNYCMLLPGPRHSNSPSISAFKISIGKAVREGREC